MPSGAVPSALALVEARGARLEGAVPSALALVEARLEEHRGSCREGLLSSTLALDRSCADEGANYGQLGIIRGDPGQSGAIRWHSVVIRSNQGRFGGFRW